MDKKYTKLNEVHADLVTPVCALEEVCESTEQDAMVNVIAIALRKILDDIEMSM